MHAEQPQLAELTGQLAAWDGRALVPLAEVWSHLVGAKPVHSVANRPLLIVQERVDGEQVQGSGGRLAG
jgi:hypothetical protein